MKRWLASGSIVLACLAVGLLCGCNGNTVVPPEGKPVFTAMPGFDRPGGVYAAPVSVQITCTDDGAAIYYTTDSSVPSDTNGMLYTAPIQVDHSMTIRACAYADGSLPSIVAEAVYTISGNAPPTISGAAVIGTLLPGQISQITVTCMAIDPDGYIGSVIVDLSALGGVAAQPLAKGAGNQWSWSGALRPDSQGRRQVHITATDDQGSTTSVGVDVDASTPIGMEKWSLNTQGPVLSSPAIATDGTIYIGSTDRNLYALNPDGSIKWTFWAGGPIVGCPAVAEDGTIYFGAASTLFALSPDAVVQWTVPTSAALYSGVAVGARGTIYVGSIDGTLQAVRSDGTLSWQFAAGGSIQSSASVASDGTLYQGTSDGNLYAFYPSGRQKWTFATGSDALSSPAIGEDGTIYLGAGNGKLYAINPDGTKKWEMARGGTVSASVAIGVDSTLYVGSSNGTLAALDAANAMLKWEFLAPSAIVSSPSVGADGTIYFGCNDGNVYAINTAGQKLWQFPVGAQIASSAAIGADGTIYIGANDRRLHAIAGSAEAGSGAWPTYRGNAQRTGAAAGVPQDNMLPQITGPVAVGTLVEGRPGTISLSCSAMDPDVDVQTLVADLSAINGLPTQALTRGAGDLWSWSGTVTPADYGMQTIRFTTADTDGGTSSVTTDIRVMAIPRLTNLSLTGPLVRTQPSTVTVSCTATDPDGTIQTVQADLSAIGGLAAQSLVKGAGNQWSWTGSVTAQAFGIYAATVQAIDNEMLSATATTNDLTISNVPPVMSDEKVTGQLVLGRPGTVTVSCKAIDPDGTVSSVVANLADIGGGAAQVLTAGAGNIWSWTGALTPATGGPATLVFTATDNNLATTRHSLEVIVLVAPVITNPDVTSTATIVANLPATVTATCTVTDADNAIQSVIADLSWLGGSNSQALIKGVGNTWTWTGPVFPTGLGDLVVTFIATDVSGAVTSVPKTVTVLQHAPLVSDIQVTGTLQVGQPGTITVSCLATGVGAITGVSADLSAVGGPASATLIQGATRWSWTGPVSPASLSSRTITITAYEGAVAGFAKVDVSINPGIRWAPLSLGGALESSPAIAADGTIYIGSADSNLYAINPTGTVKWALPVGGNVQSSPAIGADGTIYVGSGDMKLYAVNPDSTVRWTFLTGARVFSSPALSADGGTVYVGSDDKNLYAVNVATGTSAWAAPFATGDKIASSPAIAADGTIYIGSWDKSLYAVNPDGTRKWSCPTAGRINTCPAIGADGTVYVASFGSTLYAVNPANGLVTWSFPLGGLYSYSSPAIGADGTIYIGAESDGGKLYAINPDGTEKWQCPMDGLVRSSPLVGSDGVIYVGTNSRTVYAVNSDGSVQWTFRTGAEVRASMALGADGTLYAASYDWNLYAIEASGSLANSPWPMFRGGLKHTGLGYGQ